ncbi:MAG: hypothetical protein RIF32_08620 [Leptospirales bacterium]|jgi:hypothetical protein
MGQFPGTPRVLKGAIVRIEPRSPNSNLIPFQYNPDTLSRTLEATGTGGGGAKGGKTEPFRLAGAPKETIKVNVEIDATDQLEASDFRATSMGVHPMLSALELLLYPSSASVVTNTLLAAVGTIELVPPDPPMTLFVWGLRRVLPVRITGFSVTEEQYDTNLNPIRAKVDLSMQVLSYNDFNFTHPGYWLYLSNQVGKEVMAKLSTLNGLGF